MAGKMTVAETVFHCWPPETPGLSLCGRRPGEPLPADKQPPHGWADCPDCKAIQDTPGAGKAAVAANKERLAQEVKDD